MNSPFKIVEPDIIADLVASLASLGPDRRAAR
jgi:hypothetical protein